MRGLSHRIINSILTVYRVCRNEIASCGEAAYESLPLKDAATLLFFPNRSDLLRFAEQVSVIFFGVITSLNCVS